MNSIEERCVGAILLALGRCRAALHDMSQGKCDVQEIRSIVESTSLSYLAKVLEVDEDELAIDWSTHLSADESERIGSSDGCIQNEAAEDEV